MRGIEERKYKRTQRFYDDNELTDLIARAREQETSGNYPYIDKLDPEDAMEEIIQRFLNLTDSLLKVLFTGRAFMRGGVADFMRKWTSSNFAETAISLKKEIGDKYSQEELRLIARIATIEAVKRTKTNLQATIVTCLKDQLFLLAKGQNSHLTSTYDDTLLPDTNTSDPDFKIQMSMLTESEQEEIENFLANNIPLSESLQDKLKVIYKDKAPSKNRK